MHESIDRQGKIVPYTVFQPFLTNKKTNNHNWKVESADKDLEKSARPTHHPLNFIIAIT